jgi:peptidoglycan hydrolase-like amidase
MSKILLGLTLILSSFLVFKLLQTYHNINEVRQKIKHQQCEYVIGRVEGKREYCYQDCYVTLVFSYDNKTTEVKVDRDRYIRAVVGSEIKILICKE